MPYRSSNFTHFPLSPFCRTHPTYLMITYPFWNVPVRIELRDAQKPYLRKHVANLPAGLLKTFLPRPLLFYAFQQRSRDWILPLYLPSLTHAADIEIPALRALFAHMAHLLDQPLYWNHLPKHASLEEGVLLYRALRILRLDHAAQDVGALLAQEMKARPVNAAEAQCVWHAFCLTHERDRWLRLLLNNIAYFDGFRRQGEGEYVLMVVEGELHKLEIEEQRRIVDIYREFWEMHRGSESGGRRREQEGRRRWCRGGL